MEENFEREQELSFNRKFRLIADINTIATIVQNNLIDFFSELPEEEIIRTSCSMIENVDDLSEALVKNIHLWREEIFKVLTKATLRFRKKIIDKKGIEWFNKTLNDIKSSQTSAVKSPPKPPHLR